MKRSITVILLVLALVLAAHSPSRAAEREVMESIISSIEVNEDASVTVAEEYDFIALGDRIKRGLLLSIPTVYRKAGGGTRRAELEIISVTLDGKNADVNQETTDKGVQLRVGDPKKELSRGSHSIVLKYRMHRMVGFFEKHDELYWNAVGVDVNFPVLYAKASVKLPNHSWGENFNSIEWYVGRSGSKSDAGAALTDDNSVETTSALAPKEGLTVVYTWDKGIITPVLPDLFESLNGLQYLLIPLLMLLYYFAAWFKVGRDKPIGTVIPLFYPPKIDPGTVRYVVEQGHDNVCFTANLIDLAVGGYLKISNKDIIPTQKKIDDALLEAQKRLLEQLGNERVSFGKHSNILEGARSASLLSMQNRGESLFTLNFSYLAAGLWFLLLFPVFDVMAGFGFELQAKFIALCGVIMSAVLFSLTRKKRGFMGILLFVAAVITALFISAFTAVLGYAGNGNMVLVLASVSMFASSALIALFWHLMPNYGNEGNKLLAEAMGLKLYMGTAEKSRLEAFNPPEETPNVFERLLPWALALGVAKTWADKFAKILEQANYRPTWYNGDPYYLFYGGGMDKFSSAITTASTPPPSSSTGSSGSDGGGSSGGGGGGTSVSGW